MSDGGGHGPKRRGFEEEHEEHENHERWLVSYADMMTLLMVLFVVMFAISQVDSKKFMALKTGLTSGFGAPVAFLSGADALLEAGSKTVPDPPNLAGVAGSTNPNPNVDSRVNPEKVAELVNATSKAQVKAEVDTLKKAEAALQAALKKAGLPKGATFRFNEKGLLVSIATDKVLYSSGAAILLPQGRRILDALAPTLATLPNNLSIDGHTDTTPISTAQFPSNWELSTARATGVLRFLAGAHHLPYSRMSATGYADTHPLLTGTSAQVLSTNRRVEILVLARVDDSAGRAVAALGNQKSTDPGTAAKSAAVGVFPAASPPAAASASASTASPSVSPLPTPAHNLLGPDPTPSAKSTAAKKSTASKSTHPGG